MNAEQLKIGQIITGTQERDAIHCAVAPVEAATSLHPAQPVRVTDGKAFICNPSEKSSGIVDPFLRRDVGIGDKFWLFLYPGSITSLRHDWTHPAFVEGLPAERAAQIRLMGFAKSISVEYDELIYNAQVFVETGEYWSEGGRFEGVAVYGNFWDDYTVATGKPKPEDHDWGFFSCSC